MKLFLDTASLEAFLKDWEKARKPLGEISETAGVRKGGR